MSFDQGNLWVTVVTPRLVSEGSRLLYTASVYPEYSRLQLVYQLRKEAAGSCLR